MADAQGAKTQTNARVTQRIDYLLWRLVINNLKSDMKHILIVDDQADIRISAALLLSNHGYSCHEADSLAKAFEVIEQQRIELILLDMNFSRDTTSGQEGLTFLEQLHKRNLNIAVVVMTAWASIDVAVQAMQLGAGDFIEKPWQNRRLLNIVKQQLKQTYLRQENARFAQLQADEAETPIATSPVMMRLLEQAERIAQTDASVLITGENGTGKSMLAKFIHERSTRANERFVSANMGAIPDNLFESELFGHKRGAFTDAKDDRLGRFDLAQNGTLLLDEIGTLPSVLQSKLLRVLETGEYESLGSSRTMTTNARIIAATNADLPSLISKEKFRKDLFYRLNTVQLHMPALHERKEDILPLAEHFFVKYKAKYKRNELQLADKTANALLEYNWPGNVRELSHCIERAVILCTEISIQPHELSLPPLSQRLPPSQDTELMTLEEGERRVLMAALNYFQGNVIQASDYLKLSKSSMYRRLEKLGIDLKNID